MDLDALRARLKETPSIHPAGRVTGVTGLSIRATLPGARIGDVVVVERRGPPLPAEIVGFSGGEVVAMPLGDLVGVGPDDVLRSTSGPLEVGVGPSLLGQVLDGLGRPVRGKCAPSGLVSRPVDRAPPPALDRPVVDEVMATGLRAIDGFLTLGVGQRIGLFSGSGVGKSTLLGAIARGSAADVIVVALVGERGREVTELVERGLGDARDRSVVVVSTSDAPALERLRAAQVATTVAEHFRDEGQRVMLLVDSITRVARAQREVGLAAGEPPARRGFPPSVFAMLPRLLERSGQSDRGSITAVYTVLVEGDDLDEPVTDEVRGILDGHIVLKRDIAARGVYPAIDIVGSISRVMPSVVSAEHLEAAQSLRELCAAHDAKRDMITLGAYRSGSDPRVDRAIAAACDIEGFLKQESGDLVSYADTTRALEVLARRHRV